MSKESQHLVLDSVTTNSKLLLTSQREKFTQIMPVQTRDEATSSRQNSLILVIDDNASDLQLLSRVLQKVNYQVLTASSGTEGLQIAKTSKPHLILLDLMMPNMDGLQVCQHLKADADLQQIPVIFLTASWEDQQLEQAFQVGAADYVTKPLKKIELLARINVHLELQQKQRLLETALKAKSQLMANLSHEIRTSLNAILGMSQFLLTTSLTTKQEKCLNLINKSGNHLLSIVNDILDFSKLEAQKRTLELHQFHLRQLIADTVRLYEVEAANQNVVLKAQVDPDLAQFFMGDSFQIRQVIYNLLSNALKFTEEGQVELRVFSLAKTTSEGLPWALQKVPLRFEIQDTGPGIAPEHQDKLFQSFYQADTSTGGTGLGLAICKQIVELMGGTIGVESQRGQGSTFWFEIDLDPCYNFQIPELIGKRLLLVTQTCSEMQAVIQQTEAWGMTVTQVETLKIGSTEISRGFLESQPYDFVLFNLAHFRRETDLQTIEQVCQELHSTQTKIIGLESQDKKHHRQQQLAFDSFLSDPLQSSQLLSCFQEFLAQLQPRFEERQLGNLLDEVTVLVVEDSVVNQQVLERHLEGLGGAADYVNHGAEALNSLQQKQYDLLLMDCKMPTLDGYETTRQIRALSIKQPIIIGLTAYKGEAEQEKSLAAGMDDCLSKPIRFERFAQLLAKWLLGDFDHWADEIAVSSSPPQNAENLSKTERWIDDEVLQELTEGDLELRQQLVGLYINQARDYLKQGQQAVADQDAIALGHCAHQLEGSSVNTGMNLAVNLAIRLDQSAQQANFQKATEILKQLEQVIEQVEQEILH